MKYPRNWALIFKICTMCQTLSEVNEKLKPELHLALVGGWPRFADQSGLSRTLDGLTLMNIEQLRQAVADIWQAHSQTRQHDWRGYLWLDRDIAQQLGIPVIEV